MASYETMSAAERQAEAAALSKEYEALKAKGLKLDLSRGKPDKAQTNLSLKLLDVLNSASDLKGYDNYGILEGIPEARELMGAMLGLPADQVFMGGSASLNMMHDCIGIAYIHGLPNSPAPWRTLPKVKFLCPSPGYDRHFAITQHFGFELITVPMNEDGPDMDVVEKLAAEDDAVKGIWCVPMYANPTSAVYSDEVVRRLAGMKTAAPDFLIMWDNAYSIHHLYPDQPARLLNLADALQEAGNENRAIQFCSTAKVTFPGACISAVGGSREMVAYLLGHYGLQTISYDKLNQLRHARYFGTIDNMHEHMKAHAAIMAPKFEAVLQTLENELSGPGIGNWTKPMGGYFISLDLPQGCAKRTVALCKEAGVVLTPAGATFPYGEDPQDSNIRIAPSFATVDEVKQAAYLLCLCARMASLEKLTA